MALGWKAISHTEALVPQSQDTLLVPAASIPSVTQPHAELVEGTIKENIFWAKTSF